MIASIWETGMSITDSSTLSQTIPLVTMSELKLAWKNFCPLSRSSFDILSFHDRLEQRLKEEKLNSQGLSSSFCFLLPFYTSDWLSSFKRLGSPGLAIVGDCSSKCIGQVSLTSGFAHFYFPPVENHGIYRTKGVFRNHPHHLSLTRYEYTE